MPNSFSASAAAFIVGQSESLPIKIPTCGVFVFALIGKIIATARLNVIIPKFSRFLFRAGGG